MGLRVLAIIPARGGSKGVPNKNKKILGIKPLIQYSIEAALESSLLREVCVSSDDDEILEIAKKSKVTALKRPDYLADDKARSVDVVMHCLSEYKKLNREFDAICLIQPTTPFRSPRFIDSCISEYEERNADSLISVQEVPHQFNPHWVFEEIDGKLAISTGEKEIITRRQNLPNSYYRDGSVYITNSNVILEKESFFGDNLHFVLSDPKFNINIDTLDDWNLAEKFIINQGE
jgi:CMP-N,N'-diacetyllegionaminic acid synthase